MQIHQSAEDYLETILMLSQRMGKVRSIDVVNELGFTKASVSIAMKKLRENGYIAVDGEGNLTLLEPGREIAERIYSRHRLLTHFFMQLGVDEKTAAEDALTRLHTAQPELALRSVTLTAKEKVCLHPDAEGHPACLPELCPYANGYYERLKDALADLLDSAVPYDRAALTETARRHRVCPFELGLDLSEWCDVVIGDYNYLFDPTVHLRRFFDAAGDYIFLIDEAHNLPDRARAMYSARFCKSSLTDAKRTLGKGKSALKTALTKADKLKKSQLAKTLEDFENFCRPYGCQKVVLTSGENGYGIPELQAVLNAAVAAENEEAE